MHYIEKFLKNNISVRGITQGTSMFPFIKTGSYVTITPVQVEGVKIGDIIVYRNKNNFIICHRLVKVENTQLIAKGDTTLIEEKVSTDLLLGKVKFVEYGRNKINLQSNFQIFLALQIARISVHLPLLLIMILCSIEVMNMPFHLAPVKLTQRIKLYCRIILKKQLDGCCGTSLSR